MTADTLGSGVTISSLQQVGGLKVGSIVNGFGAINNKGNAVETTGVTSNGDIIVEAGASDSTVKCTITASSGAIVSQGSVTGTDGVFGTCTITGGEITDSSGAIDFVNENLSTTGTITGASFTGTTVDTSILKNSDSTLITVQDGMSIEGTLTVETIGSDDSTFITINSGIAIGGPITAEDSGAVQIEDGLKVTGALTVKDNITVAGTTTISQVLDEDDFSSDSNTALATQQSIKAYVATQLGTLNTDIHLSLNTTGLSNSDIAGILNAIAGDAASGTKAKITGVSITATSSSTSTYSPGSIGFQPSVATSTSTTLNHTRNNDLLFTRGASSWAYTSG